MVSLRQWGQKYGTEISENPVLVDERDRLPLGPTSMLSHDGRILGYQDLLLVDRNDVGTREDGTQADCCAHLEIGSQTALADTPAERDAA